MEKYELKKFIKRKLNIPITPENVYTNTSIGKHDASADASADANVDTTTNTNTQLHIQNVKYIDELYSSSFMDDYFS
jgi:hypothetical protein